MRHLGHHNRVTEFAKERTAGKCVEVCVVLRVGRARGAVERGVRHTAHRLTSLRNMRMYRVCVYGMRTERRDRSPLAGVSRRECCDLAAYRAGVAVVSG